MKAEEMLQKVEMIPISGCWIWNGASRRDGYGYIYIGRGRKQRRSVAAHRHFYETFIAAIPKGMLVCHRCDVPACVNPTHLFIGTNADNAELTGRASEAGEGPR